MWTRRQLKDGAKDFLRKHYWKAFLVCLIVIIVGGGNGQSASKRAEKDRVDVPSFEQNIFDRDIGFSSNNVAFNSFFKMLGRGSPVFFIATSTFAFIAILFIILTITIGYALKVGQSRFFLRGFNDDVTINNLFSVFNKEEYFSVVKTMFIRDLYNVLWFFVFIIPGIIKAYEYSMVKYILSEQPNLSPNEAITMSREMTKGHKWDMFVLDLSFIGWNLLASLLFGIGFIFLQPYIEATQARLYNVLSHNDFDDNIVLE